MTDIPTPGSDSSETRRTSNPVIRLLRGWVSAYVAGYEIYHVASTTVDGPARLR